MKKITKLLSGGLAAAIVSSALGCSNLTFKETQISTQSTTTLVSAEQSINRKTEIELSNHTSLSEIRIDKCIEQILTDEEIVGLNNQRENVICNSILFVENNLNLSVHFNISYVSENDSQQFSTLILDLTEFKSEISPCISTYLETNNPEPLINSTSNSLIEFISNKKYQNIDMPEFFE